MKINPKYKVRNIAGEKMIIQQGTFGADMTKIISLNDSAELLFNELSGRDFDIDDAAKVLVENYEIDEATALTDAGKWADKLVECGIIEQ
jgi:hypothetical protein